MQAMILAAGRGERMRPLTDTTPKPLLQAGGEPLLARHLRRLFYAGFDRVVVNTAHLAAQIENALGDGFQFLPPAAAACARQRGEKPLLFSREKTALESAGGVARALSRGLLKPDAPFALVNADVWCRMDFRRLRAPLSKLAATTKKKGALCHLFLAANPPHNRAGDFCLSKAGFLQLKLAGRATCTFTGISVFHPRLFVNISANKKFPLRPLLESAIKNHRARGEMIKTAWRDIGTPARLSALRAALKNKK